MPDDRLDIKQDPDTLLEIGTRSKGPVGSAHLEESREPANIRGLADSIMRR